VAGCAGGRPLSEQTRAGEAEAGVELRQRMARLIGGYQLSAAIGAVARLGVADALAAGPIGPQELAARVGADARSLGRILRVLADAGLFTKLDDGRIALTALGELLRSDAPMSARRAAIASTEEWRWRAYGHLTHSVRSGEPGFALAHGCGLWEYLARDPDAAAMFNESMSRVAAANAAAIVRTYDFSHLNRLVDVGGGHGVLACAVLEANPHMHSVVFDLPGVIEGARTRVTEAGLTDRCELIAGDFFEAVPAGGDAYLLSWILHDWDDQAAARILANCRAAMREGGRLVVIEMVIPSDEETPASPDLDRLVKASDLEMLTIVGGRERTAAEYRKLYTNAGFELTRIRALDSLPWSLIEGV
jgi:ubiquinone/menaquinone biosynthesis C-methylase UbiE/DNA-binding transcriptional ArsR family regulator